jgi:hypothetical protein
MAGKLFPNAYVDYTVLDLMACTSVDDEALIPEWEAMRYIWNMFEGEKISLVTSVDEMELDFVIHMNRGGLCVTDTFQITDNIDTFEKWAEADREDTEHWRAIVDIYDRLEIISGHDDMVGEHTHPKLYQHVASILRNGPVEMSPERKAEFDEETAILRACAAALHTVYDMKVWADLKHIQYALNWQVLRDVLPAYNYTPSLKGPHARVGKNLLGLLNRLVNIGKKSCPRLPMEDRHISFVLEIVRKKYCQEPLERHISHIAHSLINNIEYHLTIDPALVEKFSERKVKLENLLARGPINLEVLLPTQLKERIK